MVLPDELESGFEAVRALLAASEPTKARQALQTLFMREFDSAGHADRPLDSWRTLAELARLVENPILLQEALQGVSARSAFDPLTELGIVECEMLKLSTRRARALHDKLIPKITWNKTSLAKLVDLYVVFARVDFFRRPYWYRLECKAEDRLRRLDPADTTLWTAHATNAMRLRRLGRARRLLGEARRMLAARGEGEVRAWLDVYWKHNALNNHMGALAKMLGGQRRRMAQLALHVFRIDAESPGVIAVVARHARELHTRIAPDEANRLFEKLLASSSKDPGFWRRVAIRAEEWGRRGAARAAASRCLELDSDDIFAKALLRNPG